MNVIIMIIWYNTKAFFPLLPWPIISNKLNCVEWKCLSPFCHFSQNLVLIWSNLPQKYFQTSNRRTQFAEYFEGKDSNGQGFVFSNQTHDIPPTKCNPKVKEAFINKNHIRNFWLKIVSNANLQTTYTVTTLKKHCVIFMRICFWFFSYRISLYLNFININYMSLSSTILK